ncbi:MAG: MarR family transcriptional regulator [Burkholderiaceae bacterium]
MASHKSVTIETPDDAAPSAVDLLLAPPSFPPARATFQMRDIGHVLGTWIERNLRDAGTPIPLAYLRVLNTLEEREGSTGRQVARATVITAQTVATILNRLEANGHVLRRPHHENKRADRWFLSDAGREHLKAVRKRVNADLVKAYGGLTRDEITQLNGLIEKLGATVFRLGENAGLL